MATERRCIPGHGQCSLRARTSPTGGRAVIGRSGKRLTTLLAAVSRRYDAPSGVGARWRRLVRPHSGCRRISGSGRSQRTASRPRGASWRLGARWDCQLRELVDHGLDLVVCVAGRLINEPSPRSRDPREHENSHQRHRLDEPLWGKLANPIEVEHILGCHKASLDRTADNYAPIVVRSTAPARRDQLG